MNKIIVMFAVAALLILGCDTEQPVMPSSSEELAQGEALNKAAVKYRCINLGTLGGSYGEAQDINDRAQVVGWSETASGKSHAFLWEKGVMTDLGTLEGPEGRSQAHAINVWGDIVGSSTTGTGETHAVLWKQGKLVDLGTPEGAKSSVALDINARGHVVGYGFRTSDNRNHAFLWKEGVITDLSTSLGESIAQGINLWGDVVGWRLTEVGYVAYLLKNGVATDLGWGGWSEAFAVNNLGHVVGYGFTSNDLGHPLLWKAGTTIDLGGYGGGMDINDRGQVTGALTNDNVEYWAVIWDHGRVIDLGTHMSIGMAINNLGMVAGWVEARYPALWIPIPDWPMPTAADGGGVVGQEEAR